MRFTRQTDYAFRVLIYLGLLGEGQATIADMAARYRISENHLMKVVQRLAQGGYVQTVRGRSGGVRLAISPDQINLGDVMRHFEEDLRVVECLDPATNTCPIIRICGLKPVVGEALAAFMSVMDNRTLKDALGGRSKLPQVLKRAPESVVSGR